MCGLHSAGCVCLLPDPVLLAKILTPILLLLACAALLWPQRNMSVSLPLLHLPPFYFPPVCLCLCLATLPLSISFYIVTLSAFSISSLALNLPCISPSLSLPPALFISWCVSSPCGLFKLPLLYHVSLCFTVSSLSSLLIHSRHPVTLSFISSSHFPPCHSDILSPMNLYPPPPKIRHKHGLYQSERLELPP